MAARYSELEDHMSNGLEWPLILCPDTQLELIHGYPKIAELTSQNISICPDSAAFELLVAA
jgi:hypothetical protein